jgi:S-adenosylmethionine:tRNA ribosyltransferase-isomerase
MRKADFHYDLDENLIAQTPLADRSASRMLRLDGRSGATEDLLFADLPALLRPGDLLVFNDTRVIPARLFGQKLSGGRVEVFIERVVGDSEALALIRASKSPKPGGDILFEGGYRCRVIERVDDLFRIEFRDAGKPLDAILKEIGHIPLPPYIARPDEQVDHERYQTVFARRSGAVAAPTAGLHFDSPTLARLTAAGAELGYLTLHVGSGTFQPLRVENLDEHRMHAEYCEVGSALVEKIAATHAQGGRVVAVGTTVLRALETASLPGSLEPFQGETRLFIRPGFRFNCVDVLLTNFHLPESTLLTLVCAFAGFDRVMAAYRHAVASRYRFFSYGDAMLVSRNAP